MPAHIITQTWAREGGGETFYEAVTVEEGAEANLDVPADLTGTEASGTDKQFTLNLDISALKSIVFYADQDMTIETNSGSAADHTITLKANKPLVWYENCGLPSPFAADATDVSLIFVTCAVAFRLRVRAVMDPAP